MFIEELEKMCEKKRTTVAAVLKAAGVPQASATYWRNGSEPNLTTVYRLAAVLKIKPSRLVPDYGKDIER